MDTVTCPYCEEEVEICHDDGAYYDENRPREIECEHCEKKFMVHSSMSWSFEGEKADCLNGGEHDWQQMIGAPREHFVGRQRCEMCGEERKI